MKCPYRVREESGEVEQTNGKSIFIKRSYFEDCIKDDCPMYKFSALIMSGKYIETEKCARAENAKLKYEQNR